MTSQLVIFRAFLFIFFRPPDPKSEKKNSGLSFYSQCIFTCLLATVVNLNEPEHQLIAKLIQPMGRF